MNRHLELPDPSHSTGGGGPRVAYIVSRFPKLTETFVLYELLAVTRHGIQVDLYPLLKGRHTAVDPDRATWWRKLAERILPERGVGPVQAEAAAVMAWARFEPFMSLRVLAAQWYFMRRRPRIYFATLLGLIRPNLGSANRLAGALCIFPKSVRLAQLAQRHRVQHVHAHFANHPAAAAYIIHRLTRIPYSFTAHGSDLHLSYCMLREKVALAAFVGTVSDYNRDLIVGHCGEQARHKVRVLPYGVDTRTFHPDSSRSTRASQPVDLTIACIGRIQEVKGHIYLIEACRLLKARGVKLRLLVVGDGPLSGLVRDLVRSSGLQAEVEFLGRRTREEIAHVLRFVDVLVAPSVFTQAGQREGMPTVLLEAMASEVAVVASRISGIPEVVRDGQNGLLVPERQPEALAEALERLHRDPELRLRLARAGRATCLQRYSLDEMAGSLAALFAQSAAGAAVAGDRHVVSRLVAATSMGGDA
jgi:glycosyltransferase involved in cell wall biosynthesis